MKKYISRVILSILFCQITAVVFSQKVFVREIYYPVKTDESIVDIRKKAINELKSRLSDELGGYIMSQSVMKRGERDTAYYESFEQKTQSISLAYMKVFVDEEKEMGDKLYLKARIEMDDQQLDKELKDAGFSDKKELLQVVIALMEANNIGAYDFKLSEVANTVLSGFSTIQNRSDQSMVSRLIVKNNGQLFDGDKVLDGSYEILYLSGNYAFVNINDGLLENDFQVFNSKRDKVLEGHFKKGDKDGIWQEYLNGQLICAISYYEGSFHGISSWYAESGNKPVRSVEYEHGIAQRKTLIENENGKKIQIDGTVDKYENWDGLRVSTNMESNIVEKAHYKSGYLQGEYLSYYSDGQVEKQGIYEEGKRVGQFRLYHSNGNLKSVLEYSGKENEPLNYQHFYENGKPRELLKTLSNGHVKEEIYYETGQLKSTVVYPGKGREALSYQFFHENGKIKKEKKILGNGRFIIESFYETGNSQEIENYVGEDIKDGVFQTFYANGQLKEEEHYVNGCKEGIYKLFEIDGNPIELKTFKTIDGQVVLDGILKKWLDGHCYMEGNYKNGKKNGVFITYYSGSTQPKKEEEYVDDVYHGYIKEYFENGVQSDQQKYVNGTRDGEWFSITSGGEKENLVYKDDKMISRKRVMANGQITEEEYPLNGKPGIKKVFYPNGQLRNESIVEGYGKNDDWLSPKKCGLEKVYFDNGTIQYVRNWLDDKLNGINKTYYKTGLLKDITYYSLGKKEGKTIQLSEDGIRSAGAYLNNRKNGQWIFFNNDGTARKVEYDQSGRESSEEIISGLNEVNSLINSVKDDWSKHVD